MIRKLLNRFINQQAGNTDQGEQEATREPETDRSRERQIDPFKLGLRDDRMGGWFDLETGTIIGNFQIDAEDIVLDVGCGDGGQANFCAQRGAHIILADIDEANIKHARQRLERTGARRVEALVSDSNPLPIADEIATKIITSEVIEHVDDPNAVLRELARVGKPGAHYLLSAPDPVAEHMQEGIAPEIYFQKPNHIRIIERDEFEQMITDAGLVIEQRIAKSFYWNLWWLFFWICEQQPVAPWHPLLTNWANTWDTLTKMDNGLQVKTALDNSLPRSQVIIARKPR